MFNKANKISLLLLMTCISKLSFAMIIPVNSAQSNEAESFSVLQNTNPYEILGIAPNATRAEIERARRILISRYHPDRNNSPLAQAMFLRIQEVSDALLNNVHLNSVTLPAYNTQNFIDANYFTLRQELGQIIREYQRDNLNPEIAIYLESLGVYEHLKDFNPINEHSSESDRNQYNQRLDELTNSLQNAIRYEILKATYNPYATEEERIVLHQVMPLLRKNYLEKGATVFTRYDLVHYFYELYRILNMGAKTPSRIKIGSLIGKISNACSALRLPWVAFKESLLHGFIDPLKNDTNLKLARIANIIPSIAALGFYSKEKELASNAETIARYNEKTDRNLTKDKIIQTLWLTLNKTLPYAGYVYSRVKNDHVSYSNAFSDERAENNFGSSFYTLLKLKSLADISEIVRKHYRYKSELGNYKAFTENEK